VGNKITKTPDGDPALFYFYHYDTFLRKNMFTGLETSQEEVKVLMKLADSETYLRDAVLSLGAMQALRLGHDTTTKSRAIHHFALRSYTRAVAGLRRALDDGINDVRSRATVLWTTLLLGLFEVSRA
jgi:hypothetical protein